MKWNVRLVLVLVLLTTHAAVASAGPGDCQICQTSPDFTPCGTHGVCVNQVCWQFCQGPYGSPGCESYPRGDVNCSDDVCSYYGLASCPVDPADCCGCAS